jgi:hypothetical protein
MQIAGYTSIGASFLVPLIRLSPPRDDGFGIELIRKTPPIGYIVLDSVGFFAFGWIAKPSFQTSIAVRFKDLCSCVANWCRFSKTSCGHLTRIWGASRPIFARLRGDFCCDIMFYLLCFLSTIILSGCRGKIKMKMAMIAI